MRACSEKTTDLPDARAMESGTNMSSSRTSVGSFGISVRRKAYRLPLTPTSDPSRASEPRMSFS